MDSKLKLFFKIRSAIKAKGIFQDDNNEQVVTWKLYNLLAYIDCRRNIEFIIGANLEVYYDYKKSLLVFQKGSLTELKAIQRLFQKQQKIGKLLKIEA